jgi:hypothetical protein
MGGKGAYNQWKGQKTIIGRGRPREQPNGTSGRACVIAYFPGEALRGHMTFHNVISGQKTNREKPPTSGCASTHPTLPREPRRCRVTFDDVTSGQKAPLGCTLHNIRLRMRTPFFWSLPVALSVMRNGSFCTTTIVRKKRGKRLRMRTRSLLWLSVMVRAASGDVGDVDDVTSGSSTWRSPWNTTWTVLIYYCCVLPSVYEWMTT